MSMIGYFTSLTEQDVQRLRDGDESLLEAIYEDDDYDVIDLDKSWHGVHFVLAGDPWGPGENPEGVAVMGGTEIGPDLGYGSGRIHTPEQVKEIDAVLNSISEDAFCERFDAESFAEHEIYPDIWDEGEEALEYLMFGFQGLKQAFANAAARDQYLLAWIA